MFKIIVLVLQLIAVCGGVFIGLKLKSPAASSDVSDAHAEGDAGHKKSDDKKHAKKSKKDGHGDADGHGEENGSYGYLKFGRPFIVPVMRDTGKNALVVLEVNLEVPVDTTEKVYAREPKLRDAILSALLALSNEGAFDHDLLADENIAAIRERLLVATATVLGEEGVHEVLILNIAKQTM